MNTYTVAFSNAVPELGCDWNGPAWGPTPKLSVSEFRPEGSMHRPLTEAKLLHNQTGIAGIFRVEDGYVRCVHEGFGSPVYRDSCVEFFFRPENSAGYFHFEFNCGGSLLCGYITDHERTSDGFRGRTPILEEDCRGLFVSHSMPGIVAPEIEIPTTWFLEFYIPLELIEKYSGLGIGKLGGRKWPANFFKCGDDTSHPHWASWTPLPQKNFHLPEHFGRIVFG